MFTFKFPKVLMPFECPNLIRLGKQNDGGYLVNPVDVLETKHILSFGIGSDWSFENDFLKLNNCSLDAFDKNVEDTKETRSFFNNDKNLIRKNIDEHTPLYSIVNKQNIFLKCDIDGAEYKILDDIIKFSDRFTGIVIEFHDINQSNNFNSLTNFVSKLNQKLIHIHVNNYFYYKTGTENIPDVLELSFSSASNLFLNNELKLPNKLDMPNNPFDQDFNITF